MVGLDIKMEKKNALMTQMCRQKRSPRSANQEHAIVKFLDLNEPDDKQKVPLAQVP